MVESSPATRGARVRFPANASFTLLLTFFLQEYLLRILTNAIIFLPTKSDKSEIAQA